jgi:hypothetical protein
MRLDGELRDRSGPDLVDTKICGIRSKPEVNNGAKKNRTYTKEFRIEALNLDKRATRHDARGCKPQVSI